MASAARKITQNSTLRQSRNFVKKNVHNGILCPCCNKYVRVYKRKLHAEMARFLINLIKVYAVKQDWVNVREVITTNTKRSTDGSYLVHWGLVVKHEDWTGYYRPTVEGVQFALGKIAVPKHVFLLNNVLTDIDEDFIKINEALGTAYASERSELSKLSGFLNKFGK